MRRNQVIITIVGAGNAGSANAFVAAENGHEVRFLKSTQGTKNDEHFEAMQRNGGLWGIDNTKSAKYSHFAHEGEKSFKKLAMITRNPEEAIEGAHVIMVFVLIEFQGDLAKRIARYFTRNQLVILVPGYMGSTYFQRHSIERPILAEGESNANDAFIHEPGCVKLIFKNVRNCRAYLPASTAEQGQKIASQIFRPYRDIRENIVASALHNPNLIIHTVGMHAMKPMMDYCAKFHPDEVPCMYKDALGTDFAWAVLHMLDKEKMDVIEAYGCERIPYLDACKFRNEEDLSKDSRQVFEAYKVVPPGGPSTFDYRYITEDVPCGLVLLSSLGKAMGVPTPTCDHVIQVVNAIMGRDYYATGRTLERLGIGDLSKEELLEFVNGGTGVTAHRRGADGS
jgi:opine dehydrogenase